MVRKKKKDDSGLTKNQQVIIVVAVIGVIGAFVGGPTYNSMWQDRAIVEISFGTAEDYPLKELQFDGTNYYVDIVGINRGKSQTLVLTTVAANGASISFNQVDWAFQANQKLLVRPDEKQHSYRFFVKPENPEGFTLEILIPTSKPLIDQVFWIFPLNLEFEFIDEKYTLTRSF